MNLVRSTVKGKQSAAATKMNSANPSIQVGRAIGTSVPPSVQPRFSRRVLNLASKYTSIVRHVRAALDRPRRIGRAETGIVYLARFHQIRSTGDQSDTV